MDEQDFYEGIYREVQDSGVSGWYVRKSHKLLERGLPIVQDSKILEVGGNIGEHIQFVTANYSSYTLTDYRQTGFKGQNDKIQFQVADVERLPFKSGEFDRTISTCLLHHLGDPKLALEEMRRVTVNNGRISILVPCDPGLAYRIAKSIGPSRKWRRAGIASPNFYHYTQHRNHYPGIESIIRQVFRTDDLQIRYWPFRIKSWNFNLFTTIQIQIMENSNDSYAEKNDQQEAPISPQIHS
jgi:phosphatidylethanolamine/phosphatidyl-N-methylethanolamine N-methyltransferase